MTTKEANSRAFARKFKRYPPERHETVILYIQGQRFEAAILDESNGGLGLTVPFNLALNTGSRLRLVRRRRFQEAIIAYARFANGKCRLGLQLV